MTASLEQVLPDAETVSWHCFVWWKNPPQNTPTSFKDFLLLHSKSYSPSGYFFHAD